MPIRSKAVLLCLLFILWASSIKTCMGIHEDEQGLKDWILRFAGDVRHAAFSANSDLSLVYVASTQGAVSALDLTPAAKRNLTWRETLPDPPACISATEDTVVAVTLKGSVFLLNPETGFVETLFDLKLPENFGEASHAACLLDGDSITTVLYDSNTAAVYAFKVDQEEEEVPVASSIDLGKDVKQLHLSSTHHLWVVNADEAVQYDTNSANKVFSVQGSHISAASTGEFIAHHAKGFTVYDHKGNVQTTESCSGCRAVFSTQEEENSPAGVVWLSVGPGNALLVHFPGAEVLVPQTGSAGQAEPLLSFQKDGIDYVLIRSGSGHLLLVKSGEGLVWERPEGLSSPAATVITDPIGLLDHFHFNKQVLLASRFGVLYSIPVLGMGEVVEVVTDFSVPLLKALKVSSMEDVRINHLFASNPTTVLLYCVHESKTALVTVDLANKQIDEVKLFEDVLIMTPQYRITKDMTLHGALSSPELHVHVVHATSGLVEGFVFPNQTRTGVPTWSLKFPSPIIAYSSGMDVARTAFVNELYVYHNTTEKGVVEEVRRRYPMGNVIVVAHYEPSQDELSTLVVTAVDGITGGILASSRHANVEGEVKMVIVEHAVVYHFMDAHKMRYCFGVWELFQDEKNQVITKDSIATIPQIVSSFFVKRQRAFSSRAAQPPTVSGTSLGVYGGPVVDLGVTVSQDSIARKSLVLAFATGRVAVVEVRRLFSDGQMPMPDQKEKKLSHVMIFSPLFATHKYRLALPQKVVTEPTNLESSCHVLVTGLDLFYVRSSSGKPFDLLNSDYNKPLLVTLVIGIVLLTLIARYFVTRKSLSILWS